MRGGNLDQRVRIYARRRVRDPSTGEWTETWDLMGEVWAERLDGKALERFATQQKVAEVECGFRMRYAPALMTITPDRHKLAWNGQDFEVLGVIPIQRRQGVAALCVARGEGRNALGEAVAGSD